MKLLSRLVRSLSVCLLSFACTASAQTAPAIHSNWIGTFDIVHGDGSVDADSSCFLFREDGAKLTGNAGDSPEHLSPIAGGAIEGSHLTFAMEVRSQFTLQFDLRLENGHLRGTATGLPLDEGARIEIDAVPADTAWHSSETAAHVPVRLFENVAALDQKLFDSYNQCDLKTMAGLIADDLEFYHDKTGLAVGKQIFLDSIRDNICGKVRRVLVPGTLEVHRLAHYGAVEMGVHRFEHPSQPEIGVGEAKFITVWRWEHGEWKMTRAISYDHGAAAKP